MKIIRVNISFVNRIDIDIGMTGENSSKTDYKMHFKETAIIIL